LIVAQFEAFRKIHQVRDRLNEKLSEAESRRSEQVRVIAEQAKKNWELELQATQQSVLEKHGQDQVDALLRELNKLKDDPHPSALAASLSDELVIGYQHRNNARHASSIQELGEAVKDFVEWGLAMEKVVLAEAPVYLAELKTTPAPWALHGKAKVLEAMDKRLGVHSEIVKKLSAVTTVRA